VPGRSLAAASHEATHISLKKNTIFLCEAACRRCSGRGISGKSRHRSSFIVHRRQAASHGPCLLRDSAMSKMQ
ncbi:hypothetical protein, partial [Pseudomonas viridiflava]|uniref:hypothetical protein n=1 Tax=Pseudomonas viridiflava TaxID=33069 RepID=UPI0019814117